MYLQRGQIALSVRSPIGREAIVAGLTPGDFFGLGSLTKQSVRTATATATTASTVLAVEGAMLVRLLHQQHALSDRLIASVLARNSRAEAELVAHYTSSSEWRLARALLVLAHYGQPGQTTEDLPMLSPETFAEMAGIPRSQVTRLLNKFKRLGFIDYKGTVRTDRSLEHNGAIRIRSSLLTVVLRD